MNLLETTLACMSNGRDVGAFLRDQAEHRRIVSGLRENYQYDLMSPQPAEPKQPSLARRVLGTGAALGLTYVGAMGGIGAARGIYRRYSLRKALDAAAKATETGTSKFRGVPEAVPSRSHWINQLKDSGKVPEAELSALRNKSLGELRKMTSEIGGAAPRVAAAEAKRLHKVDLSNRLRGKGYITSALTGAVSGIANPLRTLYHASGLGYINKNW